MQPMAMASPPINRKGGVALWLGIALVVVGIAGGITGLVAGFKNLQHRVDELQRVPLSQGGALQLSQSGTYKVFVERPSSGGIGAPYIAIRSSDGQPVPLQSDSVSETYDVGGRHGRKIGKFYAPEAGRYELSVPGGSNNGPGQIAVGRRSPLGALVVIGVGMLGGGAAVVIGIILIIVGAVRRSRSKRPPVGGYPGGGAWTPPLGGAPGAGGWNAPPPGTPGGGGWGQPAPPGGWAPPPAAPAPAWTPPQTDANTTWNPPPPPPPS